MKITIKIISLLIISFLVISVFFSIASINTLKQSQTENIKLFKEEYLELVRELFNDSSMLFFRNFNADINKGEILDYIEEIDPLGKNIFIINLTDKTFENNFNNPEINKMLDQATIEKFIQNNLLNQKNDLELDNFNEFILDQTNTIAPVKISLQIHPDRGHIVGYYKIFTTAKVRILFIEGQNQLLFQSYVTSLMVVSMTLVLLIIIVTIISMQNIIIKPLTAMASGLKQVQEGNIETKLDIRKNDEMGEIAVAFNSMTEDLYRSRKKLNDYATNLEGKVKGRTQELGDKNQELEKLNQVMINRELKMIQLKQEIDALRKNINTPPGSTGV